MKKDFLYSMMERAILILLPMLLSAVLFVLHLIVGNINIPLLGCLTWLVWLLALLLTIRKKSADCALSIGILLFLSFVFYMLSFAAKYEIFTLPSTIQALFTLLGSPYEVTASEICYVVPQDGTAAILTCTAYLGVAAISFGYTAFRLGKKRKKV